MITIFLILIVSFVCGSVCTYVVRYFALKMGIMNAPNGIVAEHTKPVAYLGGLGIFFGLIISIPLLLLFDIHFDGYAWPYHALLIGSVTYVAWGLYDDLKVMKALPKFAGQLIIAIVAVALGLKTNLFHNFLDEPFSVFWILFVINAVNFTDVCDGLVGSIMASCFLMIGILLPGFGLPAFLIGGAVLGFLVFNFPPASIFLGDAGSHLLGFLLAATGILGSQHMDLFNGFNWMVLIASLPLFELIFITVVRIRKGIPWWKGSPDHFSIRLKRAGWERWKIDLLAIIFTVTFVSMACLQVWLKDWLKWMCVVIMILTYAVFWKVLLRWEKNSSS